MKLSDILITKENHKDLCPDNQYDYGWKKALEAHTSLNEYFTDQFTNKSKDYGGKYHTWLRKVGVDPNTENGWWSLAAIDHDNITFFIECEKDETENGPYDQYASLLSYLRPLYKIGSFRAKWNNVRKLCKEFPNEYSI